MPSAGRSGQVQDRSPEFSDVVFHLSGKDPGVYVGSRHFNSGKMTQTAREPLCQKPTAVLLFLRGCMHEKLTERLC